LENISPQNKKNPTTV